jgi:hypothetical protein
MKLEKWTRPKYYMGANWPEHYVFLSQSRDSDILEQSNFTQGLAALGGESDTVVIVNESHWLCGWVDWIAIHESDTKAIGEAERILDELENYPVLDEWHFSLLEFDAACDAWKYLSIRDRVELLHRYYPHGYDEYAPSVFCARRDEMPELPHLDYLLGH